MKVIGKGLERTEQITCRALLFISVIAFILCFIIEYFLPFLIETYYWELVHMDFLKEVMLGMSGSAFISFVCVIFPYSKKKNGFIKRIKIPIKLIYFFYLDIYVNIMYFNESDRQYKKYDVDTYEFELELLEEAHKMLEIIDEFIDKYKDLSWTSPQVDKFIAILHHDVKENMIKIIEALSPLFPEEYREDPLKTPFNLKKDFSLKEAEKNIFNLLFNEIKMNLEIEKIKKTLKPFNFSFYNKPIEKIAEVFWNHLDDLYNIKSEQGKKDKISAFQLKVINVINRYNSNNYQEERKELEHKFGILHEIVMEKDKVVKNEFLTALNDDRMADAKKIIRDLENKCLFQ